MATDLDALPGDGETLRHLRALSEKATPGPWETDDTKIHGRGYDDEGFRNWVGETCLADDDSLGISNAAFIVACVNYVREEVLTQDGER